MGDIMNATAPALTPRTDASRRFGVWLPWLIGGAFILLFALRDLLLTQGFVIDDSVAWGRDFINVWTGGHLVRDGHLSTLSNVAAYQAYQQSLFGPIGPHNYSYPPVSYPVAAVFSLLSYPVALITWQLAGAAFFIWAAKPWWPENAGPAWLAALTPAALVNLWAGHYGFFIGGLFLLGWHQIERQRPILAGICFGLLLIKPHLAILIPLALAMRKEWRAIFSAAGTAMALFASTAAIYGLQPWIEFLFGTSRIQAGLIDPRGSFFGLMSTSPASATFEMFGDWRLALVVQLGFCVLAVALVVMAGLRRAPVQAYALLVATATFLILPYAFNYDMTVPMIGALAAMSASASKLDWRLGFYGFLAPQLGMVTAAFGLPLMPIMIAGLAIAQFRMCCRRTGAGADRRVQSSESLRGLAPQHS